MGTDQTHRRRVQVESMEGEVAMEVPEGPGAWDQQACTHPMPCGASSSLITGGRRAMPTGSHGKGHSRGKLVTSAPRKSCTAGGGVAIICLASSLRTLLGSIQRPILPAQGIGTCKRALLDRMLHTGPTANGDNLQPAS